MKVILCVLLLAATVTGQADNETTVDPGFTTTTIGSLKTDSTVSNISTEAPSSSKTSVSSKVETTIVTDSPTSDIGNVTSSVAPTSDPGNVTSSVAPTTMPPNPPTASTPTTNTYDFSNSTDRCMILQFAGQFHIPYKNTDNKSVNAVLNIMKASVANGTTCVGNDPENLVLSFGGNTMSITFEKNKDKKVEATEIILDYVATKETFPRHPQQGKVISVNGTGKWFTASTARSYKCDAKTDIKLTDNVVLTVSHVQVQAFRNQKDKKFSLAEVCDSDDKTSNVVPIAVGCALAALVLIVLVAYCIGRRRSRQKGYQSV